MACVTLKDLGAVHLHVICPYSVFWACFDLIAFTDKDNYHACFPRLTTLLDYDVISLCVLDSDKHQDPASTFYF